MNVVEGKGDGSFTLGRILSPRIMPLTIIATASPLAGALAFLHFALKQEPSSSGSADHKNIESQLAVQIEELKQPTEKAKRAAEEAKLDGPLAHRTTQLIRASFATRSQTRSLSAGLYLWL